MKKEISPITLLLISCGAFFLGYFIRPLFIQNSKSRITLIKPAKKPADYIPYAQAQELVKDYILYRKQNLLDDYVKKQCMHITNGSVEETKSVWFSYNELNGFLQDITDDNADASTDDLGIRVYFGVYPDTTIINKDHPYANRMTIFFVPTLRSKDSSNGNIEAIDQIDKSQPFLALPPYDHGKLCPPDTCGGSAF